MDINEIRHYPHKIKKINITNNNNTNQSDYDTAMLKITIDDKNDKKDNEVIVFSKDANLSEIIPSKKHQNDYYLSIENKSGVSIIYAHFLISDLYEYTEDESNDALFISYDLSKLHNHITSIDYKTSNDSKPKISSLIQINGELKEKDPNYKHYSNTHLPISSRYNTDGSKKLIAPILNRSGHDYWSYQNVSRDALPAWEARIPYEELEIVKPNESDPINVYLNYQYLPTSTKYHEHFFGFEGKATTQCKDINILDGDNLDIVNTDFGTDGTYRLINIHDKDDTRHKIFVSHNIEKPLIISDPIIHNETCSFIRNKCHGYYTYTPMAIHNDYGLHTELALKKDTSYILKYYVYVPSHVHLNKDEFDVKVGYMNDFDVISYIGELDDIFKEQDRFLHEWVYHEIPFTTTQAYNELYIKGPIYDEYQEKQIFFSDFVLEEIVPYSPTIKYTNQGVFILEEKESEGKPNKDYTSPNSECNQPIGDGKTIQVTKPSIPYENIYIDFDDNFDINYSSKTGLLTYIPVNCTIKYYRDNDSEVGNNDIRAGDLQITSDEAYVSFGYNDNTDFNVSYEIKKLFTNGINNSFSLRFYNENNESIDKGFVECCITSSNTDDECIKNLGKKYINKNGIVLYDKLNFSHLQTGRYYLRIKYTHPCYDDPITEYRRITVIEEEPQMSLTVNDSPITNHKITINSEDDFPLKVNAYITAQDANNPLNYGYCELSIDDEVKYTTLVDYNANADFYLNYNTDNLKNGTNIKVMYYHKKNDKNEGGYFEPLACDYFNIEIPNNFIYKDPVPIRTRILDNNNQIQSSKTITLKEDDCLLIDLDTSDTEYINHSSDKEYINYSIRLYKGENPYIFDNGETYINITSHSDDSIIFGIFNDNLPLNANKTEEYTIVTDNMINDITNNEINYLNNKYRQHRETFTVVWERKEA